MKSRYDEINEFRSMLRDIVPLCDRAMNIADFIEARYDLGLIQGRLVTKLADDVIRYCYQIEDEVAGIGKEKKPKLDAEERLRLLNERETKARNNVRPFGL